MGAGQSRAAAGSGSGSLRKARIRPDTAAADRRSTGADRAHLFRHSPASEEELFGGSVFQGQIAAGVAEAPPEEAPLDAVAWTRRRITMLDEFRRDLSRQRHSVIRRNPELGEPELAKLAGLSPSRHRPMASLRSMHTSRGTAPGLLLSWRHWRCRPPTTPPVATTASRSR